jgi:hypothetical protein
MDRLAACIALTVVGTVSVLVISSAVGVQSSSYTSTYVIKKPNLPLEAVYLLNK